MPTTLPADPQRDLARGINALLRDRSARIRVMLAGRHATPCDATPRSASSWSTFMQQVDRPHRRVIEAERDRGRGAGDHRRRLDLATALNLMNERVMIASFAGEQPAVPPRRVVDTLAHIWMTTIYGGTP